jgi:hypothetical protein
MQGRRVNQTTPSPPQGRAGGIIGIPEAPVDGSMYGRENALWDLSVPLAGGTMTGTLVLAGPAPNDPQSAVTKEYVDTLRDVDGGTY